MKRMNTDRNNLVVMSNDLIRSKSNLTLAETKLLRLAIMQIVKTDTEFLEYKVSATELSAILGILRDNLYRDIDNMTTNLLSEIVCIRYGEGKKDYYKFQWVSSCRYEKGEVTIKLHDSLKPYLINLSKYYTQYVLADILMLKNVYAVRIYELIRQEMRTNVYNELTETIYLSLDTIRTATNTDTKYKKYGMLKERVIVKAVNEINDKLQYMVEYEEIKESRKVIGIKFTIKDRKYWSRITK